MECDICHQDKQIKPVVAVGIRVEICVGCERNLAVSQKLGSPHSVRHDLSEIVRRKELKSLKKPEEKGNSYFTFIKKLNISFHRIILDQTSFAY